MKFTQILFRRMFHHRCLLRSQGRNQHFGGRFTGVGAQKMRPKNFMNQSKYKLVIIFQIYFHASDAFQQLLKLPHCILKTTPPQIRTWKHEIMIDTFLIRHFGSFLLGLNSINCDLREVSVFGVILVRVYHISPYSSRMRENADQNNSEYGHFLRSGDHKYLQLSI